MIERSQETLPPGVEGLSAHITRLVPGRVVFLNVDNGEPGKKDEVIALKGDHILVDEDGKTRPYRGESFSELGIKIGASVTLLARFGDNVRDYMIVAKREREYRKAFTAYNALGGTIAAALAGFAAMMLSGQASSSVTAMLTRLADITRHLF